MPKLDTAQRLDLPVHTPERAYVQSQPLADSPQYSRSDLFDRGRFRQDLPDRVLHAKAFLCPLPIFNVRQRSIPFADPTALVAQRHSSDQEPAIFAVSATMSC